MSTQEPTPQGQDTFDFATLGKAHKQRIRAQLAAAYVEALMKADSCGAWKLWNSNLDELYKWVMKEV